MESWFLFALTWKHYLSHPLYFSGQLYLHEHTNAKEEEKVLHCLQTPEMTTTYTS